MSVETKTIDSPPILTIGGEAFAITHEQYRRITEILTSDEGFLDTPKEESVKSHRGFKSQEELVASIQSLKLERPICFFDIESTGLDIAADRVVQISVTKIMPDGEMITKNALINPMIAIKKEAEDIHGITNEMLIDKPKFSQIAKSMYEFIKGCYLGGYNNNFFDNSMLQEEFLRCGIEYPPNDVVSIDACSIFKNFEKRDLASALKFYCDEKMENAHDANADNNATIKVFLSQVAYYDELRDKPIEEIAKICRKENAVDFQNKIIIDSDGDYVWNFGQHMGKKIKLELSFGDWVLTKSFPQSFKNLVSKILQQYRKK